MRNAASTFAAGWVLSCTTTEVRQVTRIEYTNDAAQNGSTNTADAQPSLSSGGSGGTGGGGGVATDASFGLGGAGGATGGFTGSGGDSGACDLPMIRPTAPWIAEGGRRATMLVPCTGAMSLAVDSTSIYWANAARGIMKATISGGAPTMLAPADLVTALAVGDTSLYWVNFSLSGTSAVMKVSLSGGTPTTVASGQPGGVAVDATSAYWTDQSGAGTVMKQSITGGRPVALASGVNSPSRIAVDTTSVYWVTRGGSVMQVPIDGGPVTTLATEAPTNSVGPSDIAAYDGNVFWLDGGNGGSLHEVSVGGGPVTTLATGLVYPEGLVVDATGAYWTDGDPIARVMRVPLGGGTAVMLASSDGGGAIDVAIDDANVYWSDLLGSAVWMLTPK